MSEAIAVRIPRQLIEHPQALHMRRMRGGIWLYLAILSRTPPGSETVEVGPDELARTTGLPEATVRSTLGHLKRAGYLALKRQDGRIFVHLKRIPLPQAPPPEPRPPRSFSVESLEKALGDTGYRVSLDDALAAYPDKTIQRALAGALAVPEGQIRHSRTALFLYLLKRHTHET
jgi:hypothetical protein